MAILRPTDTGLVAGTSVIGNAGTVAAIKVVATSGVIGPVVEDATGDGDTFDKASSGILYGNAAVRGFVKSAGAGLALNSLKMATQGATVPPGTLNIYGGPTGNFWIERVKLNAHKQNALLGIMISGRYHGAETPIAAGAGGAVSAVTGLENPSGGTFAVGWSEGFKVQQISAEFWITLEEDTGDGDEGPSYHAGSILHGMITARGPVESSILIPSNTLISAATVSIGGVTMIGDWRIRKSGWMNRKTGALMWQEATASLESALTGTIGTAA